MKNTKNIKIPGFVSFVILILIITSCNTQNPRVQFSKDEINLINAGDSPQPMRVWTIANPSDSLLLRQKSERVVVDSTDETLQLFVQRLYATVTDTADPGVGIAAPQVGILKQIIWVQRFDKAGEPFEVYFNPRISQYSKLTQTCREGCLSIPNRMDTLNTRSYAVLVEYQNRKGETQLEMIENFTAVIFQHEIDHLNGVLYPDRMDN